MDNKIDGGPLENPCLSFWQEQQSSLIITLGTL